jgi:lipopolysaccharide transport system ATP-binding protein
MSPVPDSTPAIEATGLGKRYLLYDRPQDRLRQVFLRGSHPLAREFWALRGVSFRVGRGEVLGIIGRNGSGKSTLLQIIAGTLPPTAGEVRIRGRVAALLELGSGFNPEFTGRENVYLNGAILGFSREAMDERFDEIAAFADIGAFMEQPVKHYSSGMYVRVAFAINALLYPDILIVDEALAVGDEGFQRKCFGWFERLREKGSTILFVSHSMGTVVNLCDRAILLERGAVHREGDTRTVVKEYHRLLFGAPPRLDQGSSAGAMSGEGDDRDSAAPAAALFDPAGLDATCLAGTSTEPVVSERPFAELAPVPTGGLNPDEKRYGNGEFTIRAVGLVDRRGEAIHVLEPRQPAAVILDVVANTDIYDYGFGFVIEDRLGNTLFSASTRGIDRGHLPAIRAGRRIQVAFIFRNLLLGGACYLSCGAWRVQEETWY